MESSCNVCYHSMWFVDLEKLQILVEDKLWIIEEYEAPNVHVFISYPSDGVLI